VTDLSRTARVDVLVEGYARVPRVAGRVSLVRDAGRVVAVDPRHGRRPGAGQPAARASRGNQANGFASPGRCSRATQPT
jgi:hypothetical protein